MNPKSNAARTLGRRPFLRAALALALSAVAGCGYSLVGTSNPENLKGARSINISIFRNESSEPNLGFVMAEATRNRFVNDGRLRVVDSGRAEIVLDGVVREYRLDPIGFSSSDQVQRYRVFVKTSVQLRDLRSGKNILLQDIESESEFNVESTVSGSAENRDETNEKAASFFSEEVLSLVLEGF